MSRNKKNKSTNPLRLVLMLLIFFMIVIIVYSGRHLITQTCERLGIVSRQFSMISLLSNSCNQPASPHGVCIKGQACSN